MMAIDRNGRKLDIYISRPCDFGLDFKGYWVSAICENQKHAKQIRDQIIYNQKAMTELASFRESAEFRHFSKDRPEWALNVIVEIIDEYEKETAPK